MKKIDINVKIIIITYTIKNITRLQPYMKMYYPLAAVLPDDMVYYISQIIIKDKAADIIRKKFMFNRYISDSVSNIMYFAICNDRTAPITKDIIDSFKAIIDNDIPKKYTKQFWEHILNYMSRKLFDYYNGLLFSSNDNNNNDNYKNLKIIMKLWLNLCKKFNINLQCCEYSNVRSVGVKSDTTSVKNSRYMLKLNLYNKHLYPPTVVAANGELSDYYDNMVYIYQFSSQFTNK
ncbi:hypothetical protein PGBG_00376 [Phaeocystis globosa virus 14T]|nr:hypothetical protein PGBG_00376 [Phaeocystis globosa virus 14T]